MRARGGESRKLPRQKRRPVPQRSGLGSRIIRSLASQLAATIQTDSTPHTGTTVTLRLPLTLTQETIPQRATA
jgi:two-component sensor histidine kinase